MLDLYVYIRVQEVADSILHFNCIEKANKILEILFNCGISII